MNDKFFTLPQAKQQCIINAGYRVFAHHPYRKAPTAEIAAEACISKSLLFHYFRNKKDFYFFLWKKVEDISLEYMKNCHCYEAEDLFDAMYRGMHAKLKIMEVYPDLGAFVIRSFCEKDPEIAEMYRSSMLQSGTETVSRFLKNWTCQNSARDLI